MQAIARRAGGVALAVLVALAVIGPSYGQESDPGLQWRLLQRSDGRLYVYKDGWKYRVELAAVDDTVIDAIPGTYIAVANPVPGATLLTGGLSIRAKPSIRRPRLKREQG